MKIFKLIPCVGVHGFGLLAWFVALNFHFLFCHSFMSVHELSQFVLYIFLLLPDPIVILTSGPLRLALFDEPNRVRILHPLT
jgi:hypothetical protein